MTRDLTDAAGAGGKDRSPAPAALGWLEFAACAGVDGDLFFPLAEDEGLDWQDRARCAETDPEAFFPEKGGSCRQAKAICRRCEVRAECLEYALEHDERFGIWGGTSWMERRVLKRARRRAA